MNASRLVASMRTSCRSNLSRPAKASSRLRLARLPNTRPYTIRALQDAFRDPTSPYHLAPGTQGPAHPEDHGLSQHELHAEAAAEARLKLLELGYDPASFWEQPVVWGDHDSFQHVNNVRYVRFFESGRIKWMASLGEELGGPEKRDAMLKGKGVSLILKSLSINYKRPVTFPDTLLIAHKPHTGPLFSTSNINAGIDPNNASPSPDGTNGGVKLPKTHFHVLAVAYSYAQRKIVTESDSVLVWYDYDKLAKCDPGEDARKILEGRMDIGRKILEKERAKTA